MDLLDREIAQVNGKALGLPPYYHYRITLKPKETETSRIEVRDGKHYAITKYITDEHGRPTDKEAACEFNPAELIYDYYFYYDDPSETDEDRRKFLLERVYDGSPFIDAYGNSDAISHRLSNKNQFSTQRYIGLAGASTRPYAELEIEKVVTRAEYVYQPRYAYNR